MKTPSQRELRPEMEPRWVRSRSIECAPFALCALTSPADRHATRGHKSCIQKPPCVYGPFEAISERVRRKICRLRNISVTLVGRSSRFHFISVEGLSHGFLHTSRLSYLQLESSTSFTRNLSASQVFCLAPFTNSNGNTSKAA